MTGAVVAGAVANKAGNPGEAWVRMSWAAGLRQLGLDVVFVEDLDPSASTDAGGRPVPADRSTAAAWFTTVTDAFGLRGDAALVCGDDVVGMARPELLERLEEAALLVNLSGHLRRAELRDRPRRRVFVDIDPGFTQLWHEAGDPGAALAGHDAWFTIGENIGTPACPLPTGGLPWRPVRQPVVLEHWPVAATDPVRGFTTVATWRAPFGRVRLGDRELGLKLHEFRRFLDLPQRSGAPLELALAIDPADAADLEALRGHGWRVVDPAAEAGTLEAFRAYVAGSTGEFSCAQGVYVETCSGWLSDRTARYLASGRPAVVQDTGFGLRLPAGEGLLSFTDPAGAAAALDAVTADYERHAKAARVLAEQEFAAEVVLGRFLEDLDVAP